MYRRLDKGFWALVAMMGLAGCSDLGEPIKLGPRAELSATALDFGTVAVSATATRSVIVSNLGDGDLNGFASVLCPVYSIQGGGGAFTVTPGGQHTVTVNYSPTATGQSPCQLMLGGDIPPVVLSGEGALQSPGAQCVLSDTTLDFGTGAVGGSKQGGFSISNPGSEPLILNVIPTCGDFAVVAGGGPSTLPPGGMLQVTVQFVPTVGGQISCAIAIGPGCPEVRVHGSATSVSYKGDLKPIMLVRGCVGCHFEFTQNPSQIVNVVTDGYAPAVRVKPFDLMNSVLYQKITNSGRYGQAMPQGTNGLPAAEADKFRRWILEGALDN
jgi:HYDIN/CFA65/VesB family protein